MSACQSGAQCHAPDSAPNPTEGNAEQERVGRTLLSTETPPAGTAADISLPGSTVTVSTQQARHTASLADDSLQPPSAAQPQPPSGQPITSTAAPGEQATIQQASQHQQEPRTRRAPPVIPSPDEFERDHGASPVTVVPTGIVTPGLLNTVADGLLSSGNHHDPTGAGTAGPQVQHAVAGAVGLGQEEVLTLAEELAAAEEDERRINLAAAGTRGWGDYSTVCHCCQAGLARVCSSGRRPLSSLTQPQHQQRTVCVLSHNVCLRNDLPDVTLGGRL